MSTHHHHYQWPTIILQLFCCCRRRRTMTMTDNTTMIRLRRCCRRRQTKTNEDDHDEASSPSSSSSPADNNIKKRHMIIITAYIINKDAITISSPATDGNKSSIHFDATAWELLTWFVTNLCLHCGDICDGSPLLSSCVNIIMGTYVMIVDLLIEILMMNSLLSSCVITMRPFVMIPMLAFP
jgi:hypothetical protein